ncbi:hypothetical protein [Scytonema sp. PRP1]|uniref:hypothetical protein n=1 Tax=Scytonema sp. PRP1 TaxID=3120513 RepID=UPI002FD5D87C
MTTPHRSQCSLLYRKQRSRRGGYFVRLRKAHYPLGNRAPLQLQAGCGSMIALSNR